MFLEIGMFLAFTVMCLLLATFVPFKKLFSMDKPVRQGAGVRERAGGREGGRDGGRGGGREEARGREGARERGRDGGMEGGRDGEGLTG